MKNKKISFILIVFFIFLCLLPKTCYAEDYPPYSTTDDGTDGPDVTNLDITWKFTYYGGASLGAGFTADDFTTNSTYGWKEYNMNGESYVVLAAATHELLRDASNNPGRYLDFYSYKFDYIHYFSYRDTIQFKFVDNSFDGNVYNAIILDSCGASMYPPHGGHASNIQVLDVYMGTAGQSLPSQFVSFNGKEIQITQTGVFSPSAGIGNRNYYYAFAITAINTFADAIHIALNATQQGVSEQQASVLTYTRSQIELDSTLNDVLQVNDAQDPTDFENGEDENSSVVKRYNLSNVTDDKNGNQITLYTTDTPIPLIPIDCYSMSIGKSDLLDIDFYSSSNTNSYAFWQFIRNLVLGFSHMVMYISAAALIGLIIWRCILLVSSTMRGNPAKAAKSKKIIDDLAKAVALIVGVYVIMPMIVYLYQNIQDLLLNGNNSNYLIRVNVENVYQFNTNFIGLLKYQTLASNQNLGSALLYGIMTIAEALWFGIMFLRMAIIGGLTIIAPFTAVNSMGNTIPAKGALRSILQFRVWIKYYIMCVFIPPLLMIIFHRIIFIMILL